MKSSCLAAVAAFSLLLPLSAGATVPADTWLGNAPFALRVSCEWSPSLARRPEAELRRYQEILRQAFAYSERHVSGVPNNNIFRWANAERALRGRRLVIVLTDSLPSIDGRLLPAAEPFPSVSVPVVSDSEFRVFVFFRLDQLLFDSARNVRPDALGLVLGAFGDTLYSAVPSFLAMTPGALFAMSRGRQDLEREAAASRSALHYFGAVLADSTLGLNYYNALPLYREQRNHRQMLRGFAQGQPFSGIFHLTIPVDIGLVAPEESNSAIQNRIFQESITNALRIIGDFPPPGVWDNLFSWEPRDLRRFEGRRLGVSAVLLPPNGLQEMGVLQGQSPVPVSQMSGGTVSGLSNDSPPQHLFEMSLILRAVMTDENGRARPDRLARTVAFLGGNLYGLVQPEVLLSFDELRRRVNRYTRRSGNEADYRARLAGTEQLQRYIGSPDFAELRPPDRRLFEAVLREEEGVTAVLRACLYGN